MNEAPPFAPPYKTRMTLDDVERWFEVREDGTQVETAAPARDVASAPPVKQAPEHRGGAAKMFLKVPYSEKDAAKSLGARWDAAKRKWYVPAGIDSSLFSKWAGE